MDMTAATLMSALVLIFCTMAFASEDGPSEVEEEGLILIGFQGNNMDAVEGRETEFGEDDRDTKFDNNEDYPDGLVVDYLRWSRANGDDWFQVQARDVAQQDQKVDFRAGINKKYLLRASYYNLPNRITNGASFILGQDGKDSWGPIYRIADFVQSNMENPDGNDTTFFSSPDETVGDNALVQSMTNDLLTGAHTLSLENERKGGSFGLTAKASPRLSFDVDVKHELREGNQPIGSGTYQRISDVNGDGITDYDYFFSVRGIELPGPIDYQTTTVDAKTSYKKKNWFLNGGGRYSRFSNENLGMTYDNPFWFEGINATSGSRRGLWEEGRVSLEPSNDSWDVNVASGILLAGHTRITGSALYGEHRQDATFLPITTNPATIATADINRDGVVDSRDNPTRTSASIQGMPSTIDGMPTIGRNLGGKSGTTSLNLTVASRMSNKTSITGRIRYYNYEGKEGIQVIPARTEYVESRVKLDFKGDLILHVPNDFQRLVADVEAAYRVSRSLKLKGFVMRKNYDYVLYTDPDANSSRDAGTRAVAGTGDNIYGVGAIFRGNSWLSGSFNYQRADKSINDNNYVTAFSGELDKVRQYDIADRKLDQLDFKIDAMPNDKLTLGVGYNYAKDDYSETEYGLQNAKNDGVAFNVNYSVADDMNLFGFADYSKWDADMHLRTKCSNCSEPPGSSPWDVPNYDWFSTYLDKTTSFGVGFSDQLSGNINLDYQVSYIQSRIEQTTRNPDTPTELNPVNPLFDEEAAVAMGYDFPDQESRLISSELKIMHHFMENIEVGVWWLFEDYDLNDFQWDSLDPYGDNFLSVDDATRYLFLDSRYSDYQAHVVQMVMAFRF
jgi:hypothetical protein